MREETFHSHMKFLKYTIENNALINGLLQQYVPYLISFSKTVTKKPTQSHKTSAILRRIRYR